MSRLPIPNEILPEILSQIRHFEDESVETLISVALVARVFLEPCRQLLYSDITVHDIGSSWYGPVFLDFQSCLSFLQAYPHLARHATKLIITGQYWNDEVPIDWEELERGTRFSQISSFLPNLKSVSLAGGHSNDVYGEHVGLAILNSLSPSISSLTFILPVTFASTIQFLSLLGRFTNLRSLTLGRCSAGNGGSWDASQIYNSSRSTVPLLRKLATFDLSNNFENDFVDYILHPESPHPARQLRKLQATFNDKSLLERLLKAQTSNHLRKLRIGHATEHANKEVSISHQRPVEFTSLQRFTALQKVHIWNLPFTESIKWILDLTACDDIWSGPKINIELSFSTCSSTDALYDPEEWKRLDTQLSLWSSLELLTLAISPGKFGKEKTLPLMEKLVEAKKVIVPGGCCDVCDFFADRPE
ncbi:hypothetical protein DL96DRAFT_1713746 [Flagelloscypha sp. PMI_526]|nr:hypothetical protein DL96DRAFT_1713746 [Flagelloscypha sp. PMI_526]